VLTIGPKAVSARRDWSRVAGFLVILFGMGSVGLAGGVIGPLLVPISASTGDERLAQTVVVMPFLGIAISGLVAGWIADRLGVRGTLGVGALAFAAAGFIGFFGLSAPFLLGASFLVGASAGLMKVGAALLLGQLYNDKARARVIGYAMAFAGLIATAAVGFSGVIADWVGWRAAFLQFIAGGALVLAFTLVAVRPSPRAAAEHDADRPRLSLLAPVVAYFAAVFLVMMLGSSTGTHVPLLLQEVGVRTATTTSMVLSMQALFAIGGALGYARLRARLGRLPVGALGLAGLVLGAVTLGTAQSPVLFGAGCALFGLATGLILPYLMEGLYARAPLSVRGYALGIHGTLGYIGAFANPFLIRPLREAVGLDGLYLVLAVVTAVIGAAFLLAAYNQGRAPAGATPVPEPVAPKP